jgi:hypothetical protein
MLDVGEDQPVPMNPSELAQWVATVQHGGLLLVLVVLIAAFVKRWVVPGWVLTQAIADRDKRIAELTDEKKKWEDMALQAAGLAARFGAAAFPVQAPYPHYPVQVHPQLPPSGGA